MKSLMKFLSVLTIGVMSVNSVAFASGATVEESKKVLDYVRKGVQYSSEYAQYDKDNNQKLTSTDAALIYKEYLNNGSGEVTPPEDDPQQTEGSKYGIQGFAKAGFDNTNFSDIEFETIEAGTAQAFLDGIKKAQDNTAAGKGTIIKVTSDLNLGFKESGVKQESYYQEANAPLLHPTLIESGVSKITIENTSNLVIYSENGAALKHTGFIVYGVDNIVFRNLKFSEYWEWDEMTLGHYDRNDWDFISIQEGKNSTPCKNIWIDHCTFTKSYDGIVDSKQGATGVSITWCKVDPNEDAAFIKTQMDWLEAHKDDTVSDGSGKKITNNTGRTILGVESNNTATATTYKYPLYKLLRDGISNDDGKGAVSGYSAADILTAATAQQKSHLIGAGTDEANKGNLEITLAYNYYNDVRDRMPRIRGGNAHIYNCVIDNEGITPSSITSKTNSALFLDNNSLKMNTTSDTKTDKLSFSRTNQAFIPTEGSAMMVENTILKGLTSNFVKDQQTSGASATYQGKFKAKDVVVGGNTLSWDSTSADNALKPSNSYSNAPLAFSWNSTPNYSDDAVSCTPEDLSTLEATLKNEAGAGKVELDWTKLSY